MGILLVLQKRAAYLVRYIYASPPHLVHRVPPPRDLDELVRFLSEELQLDMVRMQRMVVELHRCGAIAIPFVLPGACDGLFLPMGPEPPSL